MNYDRKKDSIKAEEDTQPIVTVITAFVSFAIAMIHELANPTMVVFIMAGIKLTLQTLGFIISIDSLVNKDEIKQDVGGTTFAAMVVSAAYALAGIGYPLTHPALVLIFQSFATEYSKLLFRSVKKKNKR